MESGKSLLIGVCQLNYTKPDGFMLFFMPVFIEFLRCISTYSSAKFETVNIKTAIILGWRPYVKT